MKNVKLLFIALLILAEGLVSAQETHFRKGKYSEVDLQFVTKCNTITRGSGTKETYPDGFVFYFVVYPNDKKQTVPALTEFRDFYVNNDLYSDITKKNYGKAIEPYTVLYDTTNIFEKEPLLKDSITLEPNRYGYIMKTIICGSELPDHATVTFDVYLGWNKQVEKFSYSSKF
jgi:hypothetical protein